MNDFLEDFDPTRVGEIAVGVFIALTAFKLAKALARACFE